MTGRIKALICVLKTNLKKIPSGPKKIERGEYAIEDAGSKRLINLSDDWDLCFFPGQVVNMSMVYHLPKSSDTTCPGCKAVLETAKDENHGVDCPNGGINFSRTTDCSKEVSSRGPSNLNVPLSSSSSKETRTAKGKRREDDPGDDDEGDLSLFRRVRILVEKRTIFLKSSEASCSGCRANLETTKDENHRIECPNYGINSSRITDRSEKVSTCGPSNPEILGSSSSTKEIRTTKGKKREDDPGDNDEGDSSLPRRERTLVEQRTTFPSAAHMNGQLSTFSDYFIQNRMSPTGRSDDENRKMARKMAKFKAQAALAQRVIERFRLPPGVELIM